MQYNTIDDIVEEVTKLIYKNKIDVAINYIAGQINLYSKDSFEYSQLLYLRTECYQLKGFTKIVNADIKLINRDFLSEKQKADLEILLLKIHTQQGHFNKAVSLITDWQNNKFELSKSALWRGSLVAATQNDIRASQVLQAKHKEQINVNSFQEANNILYTDIIPGVLYNSFNKHNISKFLNPIERTKDIYLNSLLDFKGRIGNRLKSYSQALLVEAFVNYEYNNKYNAYTQVMTAGLLLKDCCVKRTAEGIGEILHSLQYKKTPLYSLLCISMDKELLVDNNYIHMVDSDLIKKCAIEASEIVAHLLQRNLDSFDSIIKIEKKGNNKMIMGFEKLKKCHMDNEFVISKLVSATKKNSVIPFFGAGISAWAYPLWRDLLLNISSEFGVEEKVKLAMNTGDFEFAASLLEKEVGEFDLNNKLMFIFNPDVLKNKKLPEYLKKIPDIWNGTIITTNFDHVVEYIYNYETRSITPHSTYEEFEITASVQQNSPLIIKLHGDISNVWNLIITKKQYDDSYGVDVIDKTKIIPQILTKILTSKTVLFLGCSLSNDRTLKMIYDCAQNGIEQYALVELPKETENMENPYEPIIKDKNNQLLTKYNERRKYLSKYHINRIWYPYGKHEEAISELIDGLCFNK